MKLAAILKAFRRTPNAFPFSMGKSAIARQLIGATVLKIDARGCMVHDHRVDRIGVVYAVQRQDFAIPGADPIWQALCRDPYGDYDDFHVIVERLQARTNTLLTETV